jgi:hypothetical protein
MRPGLETYLADLMNNQRVLVYAHPHSSGW